MAESQPKLYRFYRSNLATIIWDPPNNKPLAEFVDGQFYTEDAEVAQKLIEAGYPQVDLKATEPPNIMFEKGRSLAEGENVGVMAKGVTEDVALADEKKVLEQKALAAKAVALTDGQENMPEDPVTPVDVIPGGAQSPGDVALAQAADADKANTKPPVTMAEENNIAPKMGSGEVDLADAIAKEVEETPPTRTIKRRNK